MRCALAVAGACGLVLASPVGASARVHDIGTSPSTKVVAKLPFAVSVTFDRPIRTSGFSMRVIGRDGLDHGSGLATVYRGTTLRRDVLIGSPNGPYQVQWVVVAADGAREAGAFDFVAAHSNAVAVPAGAPSESARSAATSTPSTAPATTTDALIRADPGPFTPGTDPRADSGLRGALGEPQEPGDDAGSRSLFTYLPLGLGAVLVVAAGLVSLVTRRRSAAAEAENDRSPLAR